MKITLILIAVLTLNISCSWAVDQQANDETTNLFRKLVTAIREGKYDNFVADGEPNFKTLEKEQFTNVVAQLAPRMNKGVDATYLGSIRQQGYDISIWKLSFKDNGDDLLGTLSIKNGKVSGFFLK